VTKKKLQHFAENATFPHFFQPGFELLKKGFPLKGKWKNDFFHNNHPLVVELGCGKGEFTTGLAARYPEKNFIGIDLKGARMWRGAKTAHESRMKNVAFVRIQVELIADIFAPEEVDEIWITFPDPFPEKPKTKKRLTSPQFMERYRQVASTNTIIHLKTDNTSFFDYTLGVIQQNGLSLLFHTYDVDQHSENSDFVSIKTFYEEKFRQKGEKIKYLKFLLNNTSFE